MKIVKVPYSKALFILFFLEFVWFGLWRTSYEWMHILPYVKMGEKSWPLYFFIIDLLGLLLIIAVILFFVKSFKIRKTPVWIVPLILLFLPILIIYSTYHDLTRKLCTTGTCEEYLPGPDPSKIELVWDNQNPQETNQTTTTTIEDSEQPLQYIDFNPKTRWLVSPELPQKQDSNETFKFQLNVPAGWNIDTSDHYFEAKTYNLTLVKNEYKLNIKSPVWPHPSCHFKDEPPLEEDAVNVEEYDQFVELITDMGTIRIGRMDRTLHNSQETLFQACSDLLKEKGWENGTLMGNIEYVTPYDYDQLLINEMNQIVKSIKILYTFDRG